MCSQLSKTWEILVQYITFYIKRQNNAINHALTAGIDVLWCNKNQLFYIHNILLRSFTEQSVMLSEECWKNFGRVALVQTRVIVWWMSGGGRAGWRGKTFRNSFSQQLLSTASWYLAYSIDMWSHIVGFDLRFVAYPLPVYRLS
jgi:hypothetical protein